MDKAYLKLRNMESNGHGPQNQKGSDDLNDTFMLSSQRSSKCGAIENPVYNENEKIYMDISQTFNNLHSQQVFFGGIYGHNDPLSPKLMDSKGHSANDTNLNSAVQSGLATPVSGKSVSNVTSSNRTGQAKFIAKS